jgi:hypothetical protein
MIQYDNDGARVAMQSLGRELGVGVFFRTAEDLRATLADRPRMAALCENVWRRRGELTFDAHADLLVDFFRRVIAERRPA